MLDEIKWRLSMRSKTLWQIAEEKKKTKNRFQTHGIELRISIFHVLLTRSTQSNGSVFQFECNNKNVFFTSIPSRIRKTKWNKR